MRPDLRALAALLVFALAAGRAWAWTPWNNSEGFPILWELQDETALPVENVIPYIINLSRPEGCVPIEPAPVDEGLLEAAIRSSFIALENIPGSRLRFDYLGRNDSWLMATDGILLVTLDCTDPKHPDEFCSSHKNFKTKVKAPFCSHACWDSSCTTCDYPIPEGSDRTIPVHWNTWVDRDIVLCGDDTFWIDGSAETDLQAHVLHELGHMMGLDHSVLQPATMLGYRNDMMATKRTLSVDDATSLSVLYPDEGFTQASGYFSQVGTIRGIVEKVDGSGQTIGPVFGAHVTIVDCHTGEAIADTITGVTATHSETHSSTEWSPKCLDVDGPCEVHERSGYFVVSGLPLGRCYRVRVDAYDGPGTVASGKIINLDHWKTTEEGPYRDFGYLIDDRDFWVTNVDPLPVECFEVGPAPPDFPNANATIQARHVGHDPEWIQPAAVFRGQTTEVRIPRNDDLIRDQEDCTGNLVVEADMAGGNPADVVINCLNITQNHLELTVMVSANAPLGAHNLILRRDGEEGFSLMHGGILIADGFPSITDVQPRCVSRGQPVLVFGENLTYDTHVYFDGLLATDITVSGNVISATVTEHVSSPCTVTLVSDVGGVWAGSFTVNESCVEGVLLGSCDNDVDDDGDGSTDCADPECRPCGVEDGNCTGPVDLDGDTVFDCVDPDCTDCDDAELHCADRIDNDGDGLIDCADDDCDEMNGPLNVLDLVCEDSESRCDDRLDNDGDWLFDCADPDCNSMCPEAGNCNDGNDNDDDGDTDCADQDCWETGDCPEDGNCSDGVDNDLDGPVDCDDTDCSDAPACPEDCTNGDDDDADMDIDCADSECHVETFCEQGHCDDWDLENPGGIDNDGDGLVNCDDPDCSDDEACPEICGNMMDDDADGDIDCADDECFMPPCPEICNDGRDNDGNGCIDCRDPACWSSEHCESDCTNGVSDDADSLIDCNDPDCRPSFPNCPQRGTCIELCDVAGDEDQDGDENCADTDCCTHSACTGACLEDCGDGEDNDYDLLADCADGDCQWEMHCIEQLNCCDGVDNDVDGDVDCEDADCTNCEQNRCDDGFDNDGDDLIDCVDNECAGDPVCLGCLSSDDSDGDTIPDGDDNCRHVPSQDLNDADGDGVGDVCDNCPNTPNPGQRDCNCDGEGDACDMDEDEGDSDSDGLCDGQDEMPFDPACDNSPIEPVLDCPADVVIECGSSTLPASTGTPNVLPGVSASYSDSFPLGDPCSGGIVIRRVWTAEDACERTATCTQTITIVDTAPPEIACPADASVECGGDTSPSATGTATATDDCDSAVDVTFSDSVTLGCGGSTTITRTWTATDDCGHAATCVQVITVPDTTAPLLTCPADVAVECGDSTDPAETGVATANDACDGAVTATSSDVSAGSCPEVITRTWTAVDACGNSSTCVQTITVQDTVAPVVTCPADVVVECGDSTDPAETGSATANDACDGAVNATSSDVSAGSCPEVVTRTWTAVDACGNSSTCVQTITVQDTAAPVITCPADVVVECGDSTDPAETGSATASDACDGVVNATSSDVSAGSCPEVIIRTWTAVDACGNSSTCIQTITVQDTVAPVITCPADVVVECGDSTDPATTGTATANDACDGAVTATSSDVSAGSCPEVIIRTWTAVDACGNSSTCIQTITVQDTVAPVITCPADVVVECGDSTDPAETGSATANDACDGVVNATSSDTSSGSCPEVITRTWTAVDACGNSSTCIQTITVQDTVAPVVTCPADVVVECGDSTDPSETGVATANDACDGVVTATSSNVSAGSCPEVITRTWTAVDACGNSSTCVQTITVQDTVAPVITCPADVVVECGDSTDPGATGTATANDACDGAVTATSSDVSAGSCPEVITRTWTAVDACGNSSTCVQTITVQDTAAPVITCPADVVVECGDSTDPAETGSATANDACEGVVNATSSDVSAGSCPEVITRTWTAVDACGNSSTCIQTITVQDTAAPVITCPADVVVECGDSTDPAETGSAAANDACDGVVNATSSDVSAGSCPEVITRTWTAVDACGNSSTCVQTITVQDTVAPVITCPADVVVECGDSTDPAETGSATANDACDGVVNATSSDVSAGSCPEVITRTWTAVDACGNSFTCVQTITVQDTAAPVITCPADVVVECGDSTDPAETGRATANDACDGVVNATSSDVSAGSCPEVITRTWTAVDACGNSSTCIQTITVQDTVAPVITCPADVVVECGDSTNPAETGTATANDACDGVVNPTSSDVSAGSCPEVITRTWTAVDACGNSSTCVQTITVQDTAAPAITCPADVVVECGDSTNPAETGTATANDACDGVVNPTSSDVSAGSCPEVITRTWTAVDACGNSSTCIQTITVQDTAAPVITCPADVVVECGDSTDPAETGTATANDACDGVVNPTSSDVSAGSCPEVITRTWIAVDACGNSSTCVQTITVQDTAAPAITCPADVVVECGDSTDPAETGSATANDACDPTVTVTFADVATAECGVTERIERTWTATDDCGNSSTCVQKVIVEDTTAPTISCPADVTIPLGESTDPANTGMPTVSDACDPLPVVAFTDTAKPPCNAILRTWTATDACGNAVACEQTIVIESQELCADSVDNDCDGGTDCEDDECCDDISCSGGSQAEDCENGNDDDCDGRTDCFDDDCCGHPSCSASPATEDCENANDDDCDDAVDCADDECFTHPSCCAPATPVAVTLLYPQFPIYLASQVDSPGPCLSDEQGWLPVSVAVDDRGEQGYVFSRICDDGTAFVAFGVFDATNTLKAPMHVVSTAASLADVATLPGGRWIVVYSDQPDAFTTRIIAQVHDTLGQPLSTLVVASNAGIGSALSDPRVSSSTGLSPARYMVTWTRTLAGGAETNVHGRIIEDSAATPDPDFLIPTDGDTSGYEGQADVAYEPVGAHFHVAWTDRPTATGTMDVRAQGFSATTGTPLPSGAVISNLPANPDLGVNPSVAAGPNTVDVAWRRTDNGVILVSSRSSPSSWAHRIASGVGVETAPANVVLSHPAAGLLGRLVTWTEDKKVHGALIDLTATRTTFEITADPRLAHAHQAIDFNPVADANGVGGAACWVDLDPDATGPNDRLTARRFTVCPE